MLQTNQRIDESNHLSCYAVNVTAISGGVIRRACYSNHALLRGIVLFSAMPSSINHGISMVLSVVCASVSLILIKQGCTRRLRVHMPGVPLDGWAVKKVDC
jgi:hypothetical protein